MKNIFDYLNSFFYKKGNIYDSNDKISSYMLCLWLSHDPQLIEIVNDMNNHLFTTPDEQVYNYFYYKIPKGRRFIKWTKKNSEKVDTSDIETNFEISKFEASHYRRLKNVS